MSKGFFGQNAFGIVALAVVLAFVGYSLKDRTTARKIAFVDTQRLMTSFKEANQINKEIEAEDKKWKADLQLMNDSLKAFMDTMSVKFDAMDVKGKRLMQEELSLRNQQVNNFERVHTRRMQDASREKLAKVFEKVNAFMKEYGKANGYDVIFGTAQGSILFGEGSPADITNQVIEQINRRYE